MFDDRELEQLVRRVLDLLGRVSGLESAYLTHIRWDEDVQEIVYARNVGTLDIAEGLVVPWDDTLCRRAIEGGPACTSDVPGLYPESGAARDLGIKTYVTMPIAGPDGEVVGTLCGASADALGVSDDVLDLMRAISDMVALHLRVQHSARELSHANDALNAMALTDPLTGLPNRRHLELVMDRVSSAAERHGSATAVLVVDVDRFKSVNDTHGHAVGDAVIAGVAAALQRACRTDDVVGRWGGDEFVVVCPNAGPETAVKLAERLRREAAEVRVPEAGTAVTLSIGAASAAGAPTSELLRRADEALYRAKEAGRDRVDCAA